MVFLVQGSHGRRGWRNQVVDEEEEGIFGLQVDPLSNQKVKLANSQVRGNQVLLLVKVSDPGLRCLLNDDLEDKNVKNQTKRLVITLSSTNKS